MNISRPKTWTVTPQAKSSLGEGFQPISGPKQYVVQLIRDIGCCGEKYQIWVNNQPIEHSLTCNYCSPVCCSGGEYGWEQDGHHFLLMYNSLAVLRYMKGFRLFVDGVDVESGLNFKAYWRRKGLQFMIFGLVLVVIGVILACLFYFLFAPEHRRPYFAGLSLIGVGILYIVMGLIPILRKYDSSKYQHGTVLI